MERPNKTENNRYYFLWDAAFDSADMRGLYKEKQLQEATTEGSVREVQGGFLKFQQAYPEPKGDDGLKSPQLIGLNSQDYGVYLFDGMKMIGFENLNQSGGVNRLRVERMNSLTSDNSTVAGPTANIYPFHLFSAKIVKDATNRTFFYREACAWVQFYQEAATAFPTETDIGVGGVSATGNSVEAMAGEVMQWSLTSP